MIKIIEEFSLMRRAFVMARMEIDQIRPFAMRKDEFKKLQNEVPLARYTAQPGSIIKIFGLQCFIVDDCESLAAIEEKA